MALGYSFDPDTEEDDDPYGLKPATNPLATMAGAASPGLADPSASVVPSTFEKVFGDGAPGTLPASAPETFAPPTAPAPSQPKPPQTVPVADFSTIESPWTTLSGEKTPTGTTPVDGPSQPPTLGGDSATAKAPQPSAPTTPLLSGTAEELTQRFKDMTAQIAATVDPGQKAILQDKLARDVFDSLKEAGHDVKWQGDQLIVDGRPYVIGGGTPTAPGDLGSKGEPGGFVGPTSSPMTMLAPRPMSFQTMPAANQTAPPPAAAGPEMPVEVTSSMVTDPTDPETPSTEPPPPDTTQPAPPPPDQGIPMPTPPATPPGGYGTAPSGYDQKKWDDPNSDSAKYIVARGINYAAMRAIPDEAGRKAFLRQEIERLKPQLEAKGWHVTDVQGDKIRIEGHGFPPGWVDVVGDIEGQAIPAWIDEAGAGGGDAPSPFDTGGFFDIPGQGAPGAAGTPTGGVPQPEGAPAPISTAPTYTPPKPIDNADLEGLSKDDILNDIGPTMTPAALPTDYKAGEVSNDPLDPYSFEGFGDLGPLGAGPTEQSTEDLIMSILAHPESMDPRTVEMLKAKSKDELAEMALSDDDNLKAMGYATGNQDSNWLQSERQAARGRRDSDLVASNRTIDLKAAETNMADRTRAAQLGQGFATAKAANARADAAERLAEKQAAEGNHQAAAKSREDAARFRREGELANEAMRGQAADRNLKAAQQNIENQFKSAEEHRAAVQLASDVGLKSAALRQDRVALEEGFKQKAAELGQSADKIRQDYLLGVMDDLTRRFGINVGAQVDREKLSQAGREFQLDLAFRLAALKQANEQFKLNYGLEFMKLQHTVDQDHYSRENPEE